MRIFLVCEETDQRFHDIFQKSQLISNIQVCQSATTAYELLKNTAAVYDAVVIDQDLSDFTGLKLCKKLLNIKIPSPLVLLISKGGEPLIVDALRIGVESCLQKPSTEEQFSVLATALLEIARRHSDRKAREKAVDGLLESQKRLQEIVEASTVPIFVIDREHRITEWNRACETLTGLSADKMLGLPDSWRPFYPSPKPTMADLIIDEMIESELAKHSGEKYRESPLGVGYETEDFFPVLGNSGKWLFVTAAPLRNSQGQLTGAITTLQDVTETRSAIESLERVASWLAQVLDNSTVPTFVIDKDHKVTHWNRACELLTDLPAVKVLGTSEHWRAFYPHPRPVLADLIMKNALEDELAKYYTAGYRQTLLGDGYEAEGFFPSLGNNGRWLFFSAAPLRSASGEIIGAIETLHDITDRRLVENALVESESRINQIVQGSMVPTFVINENHQITEWNRACENLTGLPTEKMLGTSDQWKAFSPVKRPVLADYILDNASEEVLAKQYGDKFRRSLLGEGYEVEDFFPSLGEDGKWLFFTAAPLRDTNGKIIGAIETLQDITRRRNAEDALRASEVRYKKLSITDELTGLYNVRHFHHRAIEEIDRAERYQHPLTLLILDMDDFKHYNDTYGHPEGDLVLKRFAGVVSKGVRRTDSVYRYGGEEFVALLPETSLDQGVIVAEKIRKLFASEIFTPTPHTTLSKTLSVGVAQWKSGETTTDLLSRADQSLYNAKQNGKNQVVARG